MKIEGVIFITEADGKKYAISLTTPVENQLAARLNDVSDGGKAIGRCGHRSETHCLRGKIQTLLETLKETKIPS